MGKNILTDSKGYALVIALIMLLVLTIIGISAITTTTYETAISGNERIGTDAFYAAEAGIQVALNQLPVTTPVPRTKLGEESYYRGQIEDFGIYFTEGYESKWQFKRFKINGFGESFNSKREIEIQVKYGPFPYGTGYDN